MKILRTTSELRAELAPARSDGRSLGLVPTMGAFHDGHLSLMRRARADCDRVVVSLFVNPAQFDEPADLERYPRDERTDAALAEAEQIDYLFAPPATEVYPPGFATTVSVAGLTERLEGAHRGRAHFDAVATVVTKLFNMVAPDVAYFGQKDAQQALVIRRLARDLNIPVRIEVCPIVREPDGLAMSSRNARLSPDERARAVALSRALRAIATAAAGGVNDPAEARSRALTELARADIDPEYLEIVDKDTLAPVARIDGHVLALVAARVGATRLIDNYTINDGRNPDASDDAQIEDPSGHGHRL
jgi:pantoate--beta-alanine ligase